MVVMEQYQNDPRWRKNTDAQKNKKCSPPQAKSCNLLKNSGPDSKLVFALQQTDAHTHLDLLPVPSHTWNFVVQSDGVWLEKGMTGTDSFTFHTHLHKTQELTGVHWGGTKGYIALVQRVKGLKQEEQVSFYTYG